MATPPSPAPIDLFRLVARFYARLCVTPFACPETGLGGAFLYTAGLDAQDRALVIAANIAGAATLVATADRAAQKQAIRDGVADFLVTSLDEALRILKNQLRRREPVAVCVSLASSVVEAEMRQRGVIPNLVRAELDAFPRPASEPRNVPGLLAWHVDAAPSQWLPRLDALALNDLAENDWAARRWLQAAPRCLGRMAQNWRAISCGKEFASAFVQRVRRQVEQGEIGVAVEFEQEFDGVRQTYRFASVAADSAH